MSSASFSLLWNVALCSGKRSSHLLQRNDNPSYLWGGQDATKTHQQDFEYDYQPWGEKEDHWRYICQSGYQVLISSFLGKVLYKKKICYHIFMWTWQLVCPTVLLSCNISLFMTLSVQLNFFMCLPKWLLLLFILTSLVPSCIWLWRLCCFTGGKWSDWRDESEARGGFPGPRYLEARSHWECLSYCQRQGRSHQNTPQRHGAHPKTKRWGTAHVHIPTQMLISLMSLICVTQSNNR